MTDYGVQHHRPQARQVNVPHGPQPFTFLVASPRSASSVIRWRSVRWSMPTDSTGSWPLMFWQKRSPWVWPAMHCLFLFRKIDFWKGGGALCHGLMWHGEVVSLIHFDHKFPSLKLPMHLGHAVQNKMLVPHDGTTQLLTTYIWWNKSHWWWK